MSERAIIEVIDSLDSTSGTNALSANQGRVLKEMIDTINAKDIITIKLEDSFNEESGGTYKTTGTVHNSLQQGDKVALLSFNEMKNFIVIGKM